jgi:hypothetical protein
MHRFPGIGSKRVFFDIELALVVAQALLEAGFDLPAFFFAAQHVAFPALPADDFYFDTQKRTPPS